MICHRCHEAEMVPYKEGSSSGLRCPVCGSYLVTSVTDPILEDCTVYSLFLEAGNPATKPALSSVSKVLGCNYLQSKKVIEGGRSLLFAGSAAEVREKRDALDAGGVLYAIEPEFPY